MKTFILAAGLCVLCAPAMAVTLNFAENANSSNTPATGASGTVDISFTDLAMVGGENRIKMSFSIANTTDTTSFGAGATTSKLTGFGFDLVQGVSLVAGSFAGGTALDTFLDTLILNASMPPFGVADIGFADNSNFLGGNANEALPEGQTTTVTIELGSMSFNAASLEAAFDTAFNQDGLLAFMRFQQVNAGAGSDKLLFVPPVDDPAHIPLPAGMALMLTGVGGLVFARKSRSKTRA